MIPRKTQRLAVTLLAVISIAVSGAAVRAESSAPPHQARVVEFTFHTDLTGIDAKAHRVEAWIPLPRQGSFQTVSDLAIEGPAHTEVTRQQLYNLLNGKSGISPEMALRLEKALGGSADLWLQMQVNHDLAQVRKRAAEIKVVRLRSKVA